MAQNCDASARQYGPPIWPPLEKLTDLLREWARQHADVMTLIGAGKSVGGRPVHAIRVTDPTAADEDKEHALITALHSGQERSGTTTVFCLLEWLLSGDPAAREMLRRQVVVCVPIAHPDGYVGAGSPGNVYHLWTPGGPADPANQPEAVALQGVMDELQPEVHADIHGISMHFARYTMLENSGSSYSNLGLRSYHPEVIRRMDEAALAEGYPSDHQESDAERAFWGPELEGISDKLWVGRPRPYAANYAYNRYHTLMSASEVCWERSGLLRHRALLQIGNEIWPGEYYPGYPVRVVMSNNYHMITAYGRTAAARRRSRIELWNKQRQVVHGMADPMVEGKIVYAVAMSPSAGEALRGDPGLESLAAKLQNRPATDADQVRRFVAGWPAGQNAPAAWLALTGGGCQPDESSPVEHGMSLRLRIFFDKARITDLRVNGRPVAPSETDGFLQWVARGITYVQINIPPERSQAEDLFVVTCEYEKMTAVQFTPGLKMSLILEWMVRQANLESQ